MTPSRTSSVLRAILGRWELRDVAPLVSLAALVLFFSLAAPTFFRPATLALILRRGAVLAIVAAGLTFVLLCAEIDLAVGMMALWSASFCGWMFLTWAKGGNPKATASWPMIVVCIVLPLVSCLALGLLSGLLTSLSRLPSFIISLAMMFIAQGLARYYTKGKGFDVPKMLKTIGNKGIPLADHFTLPYSALLAAAVLLIGHIVLCHTRFGRHVYMTGGNREAARLAGVRTAWIVTACLAISALAAGVGGMVNSGRLNSVTHDQNADLLLSAVACVVLGGTSLFGGEGGMGKTLIGVLTFSVLTIGLTGINWIHDQARPLLTGVVLMVALVINGLLAKRR